MPEPLTLNRLSSLLQSRFEEGFLTLNDLPKPHMFKDMEKATVRIVEAIQNKEKITIDASFF